VTTATRSPQTVAQKRAASRMATFAASRPQAAWILAGPPSAETAAVTTWRSATTTTLRTPTVAPASARWKPATPAPATRPRTATSARATARDPPSSSPRASMVTLTFRGSSSSSRRLHSAMGMPHAAWSSGTNFCITTSTGFQTCPRRVRRCWCWKTTVPRRCSWLTHSPSTARLTPPPMWVRMATSHSMAQTRPRQEV